MGNGAARSFDDKSFDDGYFGGQCFDTFGEAPGPAMPDEAETVGLLAGIEPGPAAMMVLTGLAGASLDADARIQVAAAWQRQLAWVNAQAQASLAYSLDGIDPEFRRSADVAEYEWRTEMVAASLGWSPITTANRLAVARRLLIELPNMFALLAGGQVSLRHAMVLAHEVAELTPDEMAGVEARVLERAPNQTAGQFTRSVRRAVLAEAPEAAAARRAKAVRARGVHTVAYPDGMAAVIATMGATEAHTVFLALDAAARKTAAAPAPAGAPKPTVNARRADALLGWADHALADPDLPRQHGRSVELQVVIDLPTLLGLADNPAELIGYGPIPPIAALELAADANWRRLVTDPVDGHLLDYGTSVYRPPQKLANYLLARDRRCRFPGCSRPAEVDDFDHVIPWGTEGGITAASNCACLCRRHHRMKTHSRWRYQLHKTGAITWTAPNQRTFNVDPVGQLE
jgi:hypothetical protein